MIASQFLCYQYVQIKATSMPEWPFCQNPMFFFNNPYAMRADMHQLGTVRGTMIWEYFALQANFS